MKAILVGWLKLLTTVRTERFGSSIEGPLAWVLTGVTTVAELSLALESDSAPVTLAVFVSCPAA